VTWQLKKFEKSRLKCASIIKQSYSMYFENHYQNNQTFTIKYGKTSAR